MPPRVPGTLGLPAEGLVQLLPEVWEVWEHPNDQAAESFIFIKPQGCSLGMDPPLSLPFSLRYVNGALFVLHIGA